MKKTLTVCYGALALVATALAAVLAVVFLAAVAIGGDAGTGLTELGGTLAGWSIYVAAAAVLLGLVHIYASGEHSLTAGTRKRPEDTPEDGSGEPAP
ncbi:hypothetical protein [Actinomadura sp. WMMB 499]|uniref:hypothetical protein n=1 Tax=Actinomadura sp. WMMB 499 TaxID=1219491 RepID=UPI001248F8C5|nr:hypothetical protein [Actinomadura sp. WMMB 499]QFG22282.1 hypothetical protein F7P10_15235 [Actinomadura sp. WMMB 499]